MRIILISLFSLFLFGSAEAQQNAIEKYFSSYQEREDVTKIHVTGKIFQMATYIESDDKDVEELRDFISTVESFQMILGDKGQFNKSDYTASLKKVENEYEELMSIVDKEGTFNFRIKENRGVVKELIMVGFSENNLMVFSLTGNMNLKELSKMGSKIQMDGFGHLGKISENGADMIKVYPNPAKEGDAVNIEIPEDFKGGDATLFDLQGKTVMTYHMGSTRQVLRIDKVKAGQYLLVFKRGDVSVTKKLEVQ